MNNIAKPAIIADIIEEIREIAELGTLPDGDGVNIPVMLWAESCINRLKDAKESK